MNPLRSKMKGDRFTVPLANAVLMDLVDAVRELERKKFGWNGGLSLPVRPDVASELTDRLLSPYGIDLRGLREPDPQLRDDGTIAVVLRDGRKRLTLHVLAARVVRCLAENAGPGENFAMDKLVKLPPGFAATGYAAEIDEWVNWLLGVEDIG